MGGAIEEAEHFWELGLTSVPNTKVCDKHIDNDAIARFVRRKGNRAECDYCGSTCKVVPLDDLMVYMMDAVRFFYTEADEFMGYETAEGGYLGTTYDAEDILREQFELEVTDAVLRKDIFGSLADKAYGDENEYYDSPADTLIFGWEYFQRIVKNRSRYFFSSVNHLNTDEYRVLPDDILGVIGKLVRKSGMVKVLPIGTSYYRCRQHAVRDPSVRTEKGMTSPPAEYAVNANRMSPAGISMFYGAVHAETAHAETIEKSDTTKPFYTTVTFKTKRALNIIDLSALPALPNPFDEPKRKDYYPILFLNKFVEDLVAPIKRDGMIHINYVPTQVVTEYFRYPFSNGLPGDQRIDGIIYPSSKTGKNACVLFIDNEESAEALELDISSIHEAKVSGYVRK